MDRGSLSPRKLFTILPLGHAIDVGEKDGRLGAFGFGRILVEKKVDKVKKPNTLKVKVGYLLTSVA